MEADAWTRERRYRGLDADPEALVAARQGSGTTVSVCLPARDVESTVGDIVASIRGAWVEAVPLVDEILVVDGMSGDHTADRAREAGARVVAQADVVPDARGGKGEAMWGGLRATRGDLVVWIDADIEGFDPGFVPGMLLPLLTTPGVAIVKAAYRRALHERPDDGGRVTELCARPLLALFFPDLAAFRQPLAGETAGRRDLLARVPFVDGYGVEIGLLIDAWRRVGLDGMAEVDLGHRVHHNQPTRALGAMAQVVARTILDRAGVRAGAEPVTERPPVASE